MDLLALLGLLASVIGKWYADRQNYTRKLSAIRRRKLFILTLCLRRNQRRPYRQRRCWKFINNQSVWESDIPHWPDDKFQSTFRVSRKTFDEICCNLSHALMKKTTTMRFPISVEKRLAIALFYLKSGADYGVVGATFGVGKSTVCNILDEFCDAVNVVYKDSIKFPTTEEEQIQMANGFLKSWQFPNTLSAIDGSHIPIITPEEYGEDYYNYKGWHSTILMAAVDHKYRFTYINVGYPGKTNDAAVYQTCSLHRHISEGMFDSKFHIIGDGAFPLSPYIMKPFIGDNLPENRAYFNYRLSRARMVVECAFGRLKGRWRILLKRCDTQLEKTINIITTCCILHNICEDSNELFRHEWLQPVVEFDDLYPQPREQPYDCDGMDGQGKRNALVDIVRDIPKA